MKVYIDDYKNLLIITQQKTVRADLPIKSNKSLKHDIKFIISHNE